MPLAGMSWLCHWVLTALNIQTFGSQRSAFRLVNQVVWRIQGLLSVSMIGRRGWFLFLAYRSTYPNGHYVRSLGDIGAVSTELESILVEYQIIVSPFSKKMLESLPRPDWTVPQEEYKKRRDLRDVLICSIDPKGSQVFAWSSHSRTSMMLFP